MSSFEHALERSLEALRQGQSIDHCLRAYPEHADRLREHLVAAKAVSNAYAATSPAPEFARDARARFLVASGESLQHAFSQAAPPEEFAEAARQRFLVATGERLTEAFDNDPSPSFFASARARVLMTAHRMRQSAAEPRRRRIPSLVPGLRAAGAIAAVLTIFAGFSTYTVASADNSLPGDWQYPIKLKTEQVRLALAFSDSSKRDVRLHIAKERTNEIAELAKNGESIGPSELHRLATQTQPLADDADSSWDAGDLAKLEEISVVQQDVLAEAEPQIEAGAKDALEQAKEVAKTAQRVVTVVRVSPGRPPIVITPSLKLTTTGASDATQTPAPEASPTPADSTVPGILTPVASTPTAPAAQATPTNTATALPPVSIGTPVDAALGVTWIKVSFGRMSALMPSPKDGWYIQGLNSAATGNVPVPTLIHLSNVDATSLVTINAMNGDVYWLFFHDGRFDEIQMRLDKDGQVLVVDRDILHSAYGHEADIPLYILDSLQLAPLPATGAPASAPPAP